MRLHLPQTARAIFQWSLGAYLLGTGLHSVWPGTKIPSFIWPAVAVTGVLWGYAARLSKTQRKAPLQARSRLVWSSFVLLAVFVLGVWRFDATLPGAQDGLTPWVGESISFSGRVISSVVGRFGKTAVIRIDTAAGQNLSCPGCQVLVRLKFRSAIDVGARVSGVCRLAALKPVESGDVWRRSLARRGVWFECQGMSDVQLLARPAPWNVISRLTTWRFWVTARIARTLPRDEATLLSGILYGDRALSDEQADLMRRAGLMHLVAVSGSNVTIVVTLCLAFALSLGLRRQQTFWIVTVAVAAFVGFVGFSASVLRAALMGWLILLSRELGRIPSATRLLLIAAVVMTAFNPWSLVFDAGFGLSFLATWGLLVWTPILQRKFTWLPERFGVRASVATTCSATLMTTPYLAWAFGRMSLAGLITNVFALPLVAWIMLLGAVTALWGNLPGWQLVAVPSFGLLRLLTHIAQIADFLPWLDLRVPELDFVWLLAIYALMWRFWRQVKDNTDLSTR